MSPENLLKEIGFDINTPDFWNMGIKTLDKLMTEFEEIYAHWRIKN